MTITPASADAYFAAHPDAAVWSALPAETRAAAVSLATLDVEAKLPAGWTHNDFSAYAVYEQAVYITRTHDSTASGRVIQSQSLGSLSQSFQYLNTGDGIVLAPRAVMYIARALKAVGRTLRYARG